MADGGVVVVETFGAVGSGSSTQPPVLVRVQTKLSKDTSGTLSPSPRCFFFEGGITAGPSAFSSKDMRPLYYPLETVNRNVCVTPWFGAE